MTPQEFTPVNQEEEHLIRGSLLKVDIDGGFIPKMRAGKLIAEMTETNGKIVIKISKKTAPGEIISLVRTKESSSPVEINPEKQVDTLSHIVRIFHKKGTIASIKSLAKAIGMELFATNTYKVSKEDVMTGEISIVIGEAESLDSSLVKNAASLFRTISRKYLQEINELDEDDASERNTIRTEFGETIGGSVRLIVEASIHEEPDNLDLWIFKRKLFNYPDEDENEIPHHQSIDNDESYQDYLEGLINVIQIALKSKNSFVDKYDLENMQELPKNVDLEEIKQRLAETLEKLSEINEDELDLRSEIKESFLQENYDFIVALEKNPYNLELLKIKVDLLKNNIL